MNWTPQQQDAITVRGRSVIVSAAAGSGKTAVLVERLAQLLSDPDERVEAENIIVVTFTIDAAAQMKQRLSDELGEKLRQLDSANEQEAYAWLVRQRAALPGAKISTIHAFCFDLIRENADSCGVSPQFSIIEPAQEAVYERRAMQEVLSRFGRESQAQMEQLYNYFCVRDDTELEGVITAIAEYLKSTAFPELWLTRAEGLSRDTSRVVEAMRSAFCSGMEELLAFARMSRTFAELAVTQGDNRFLALYDEDMAGMEYHLHHVQQAAPEQLTADPLVHTVKFSRFSNATKHVDAGQKAAFQRCREQYKTVYAGLCGSFLEPLVYCAEDAAVQAQVIPVLLELTRAYRGALFEEKCRQNVLGFEDAERLALSLLGDTDAHGRIRRTVLADQLSQRYRLIMVDEFQDTNSRQDCLFKLLSRDCGISDDGSTLHYGTDAFLVGDVKQSIYSFRQANPENFRSAVAGSTPLHDCTGQEMACIYLNRNFRSAQGVLDFVNALCGVLMTEGCGEVRYDENEKLNFGSQVYTQDIRTRILIAAGGEGLSPETDMQAECIADTIASMLLEGAPVYLPGGEQRPCRPEDFCILLRSVSKRGGSVTDALRRRSIPFDCEADGSFLQLPEIRLIRNLLRILNNPMADIPMAAVLLSPVYGFTAEDLAVLRLSGSERRLFLQLRRAAEADEGALGSRCSAFLAQFSEMRAAAEQLPIEACIRELYDMTDLLSLQSLYEDAVQRRVHLGQFVQFAADYRARADLRAQSSLSGWLRYLDRLEEAGRDLEQRTAAAAAGGVAVKTIHKSKGLEYPFVFLAYTEDPFSRQPARAPVIADESGMLGLRLIDRSRYVKGTTAAYACLLHDAFRKQRSEEMRLLYVALTRAKQQLFWIVDPIREGKSKSSRFYQMGSFLTPQVAASLAAQAECMRDWLLLFLVSSDEAEHLRLANEEGRDNSSALCSYSVWKGCAVQPAEEPPRAELSAAADPEIISRMRSQMTFRYASAQSELVSKYSVTALTHEGGGAADRMQAPAFAGEDSKGRQKKLSGAARGTAVHKIMQHMDFASAAADPAAELARLVHEEYLAPEEAEALSIQELDAFFRSPLYQRIAGAQEVLRERQLFVRIAELDLPEDAPLAKSYAGTDGILIGTMDLLLREGDSWVLVDYKTDYVRRPEELLSKYSIQLGLYQKAAAIILGSPVREAYIYSFTLGTQIEVPLSEISYREIRSAAENTESHGGKL